MITYLKRGRVLSLLGTAAVLFALASCTDEKTTTTTDTNQVTGDSLKTPDAVANPIERGQYLVTVAGCNDCHTPWKMGPNGAPEPDMSRMLSGHPEGMTMPPAPKPQMPWMISFGATMTAAAGPWGVSFSQNLTSDSTGAASWPEDVFIKALRSGMHQGNGRPILPPMPWPYISKMTDNDLKAVYAYLRSIPKVKNKVPDPIPPAGGKPMAGGPPAEAPKTTH